MRLFLFIFALGLISSSNTVHAQGAAAEIAPQPCDVQYWRQMSARAWMEAEREIMQNQNLIFKPDSVLEYACFDQFLSLAAYPGGNIFSHTNYFGQEIIPRSEDYSLEIALTKVIGDALNAYKNENFSHSFLGGRGEHMSLTNQNSQFETPAKSNVAYTCTTMADVWKAAKCSNFIDNAAFQNSDGFYPFDVIKGYQGTQDVGGYADTILETRIWPASMSCMQTSNTPAGQQTVSNLGPTGSWQNQIWISQNRDPNGGGQDYLYSHNTPLGTLYMDVASRVNPVGEQPDGSTLQCADPIYTGVTVVLDENNTFADGVCSNPGCVYTRNRTIGDCVRIGSGGSGGG